MSYDDGYPSAELSERIRILERNINRQGSNIQEICGYCKLYDDGIQTIQDQHNQLHEWMKELADALESETKQINIRLHRLERH